MIKLPPSIRISLGLASIAVSFLLLGNLVGLVPDKRALDLQLRKNLSEAIAVQCAMIAQTSHLEVLHTTVDKLTEKYPEVLSVGIRSVDGYSIAQSVEHQNIWVAPEGEGSTDIHWQLPIYRNDKQWASLEISFLPSGHYTLFGMNLGPFTLLLVFFSLLCFLAFFFYINRALRAIDPTSVMPSRVRNAFDTLTEGLILVDEKERIILANEAIAKSLQCNQDTLVGMKASRLKWFGSYNLTQSICFPWQEAIDTKQNVYGFPLTISPDGIEERMFMVNSSPIIDGRGKVSGALTTFDDVTELENKNIKLVETIGALKLSRDEVHLQNVELERLATRDPMTDCLNRRAFFEKAEAMFAKADADGTRLACVMADLDKFKSINDRYGHSMGDQVIIYFVNMLHLTLRGDDLLCRYGGEEFCILLPTCDAEAAALIANKARQRIGDESTTAAEEVSDLCVSASFGVSTLSDSPKDLAELIEFADRALFQAKRNGRNQVVIYKPESDEQLKAKTGT